MDMMLMLKTSCLLFSAAALGGILMAGLRFSGRPRPPSWLAMGHGLLAAAGLTLLIYAWSTADIPVMAQFATVLFIIAAAGGAAINLLFHVKQLPIPISWMVVHAVLAIAAFVLLLLSVF